MKRRQCLNITQGEKGKKGFYFKKTSLATIQGRGILLTLPMNEKMLPPGITKFL